MGVRGLLKAPCMIAGAAFAAMAHSTAIAATCSPFTANTPLPLTAGNLRFSSATAAPVRTDQRGAIPLNGGILVKMLRPAAGIQISLQGGSVGPLDITLQGVGSPASFPIYLPPTGDLLNVPLHTAGAQTIRLISRNNEGAVLSMCSTDSLRFKER